MTDHTASPPEVQPVPASRLARNRRGRAVALLLAPASRGLLALALPLPGLPL